MVIFHCYVSSPEGNHQFNSIHSLPMTAMTHAPTEPQQLGTFWCLLQLLPGQTRRDCCRALKKRRLTHQTWTLASTDINWYQLISSDTNWLKLNESPILAEVRSTAQLHLRNMLYLEVPHDLQGLPKSHAYPNCQSWVIQNMDDDDNDDDNKW